MCQPLLMSRYCDTQDLRYKGSQIHYLVQMFQSRHSVSWIVQHLSSNELELRWWRAGDDDPCKAHFGPNHSAKLYQHRLCKILNEDEFQQEGKQHCVSDIYLWRSMMEEPAEWIRNWLSLVVVVHTSQIMPTLVASYLENNILHIVSFSH